MTTSSAMYYRRSTWVLWGTAAAATAAIFTADLARSLQGAVAVLYIAVILLVARTSSGRWVMTVGVGCGLLSTIAFWAGHDGERLDSAYTRFGVSLVAITITTLLSLRDRTARATLAEQARILELTHDTVVIRDTQDVIQYWNDGAELLYGWTRIEAVGRPCEALLRTVFPAEDVERAFAKDGNWSGEVERVRRDGKRMVLASRWLVRQDEVGRRIGVIETSTDLTLQRQADADRIVSERRYSTMFHGAGFATWESDWSESLAYLKAQVPLYGDLRSQLVANPDLTRQAARQAIVRDANQAAATLFAAESREALIGSNIVAHYTAEADRSFLEIFVALLNGEPFVETDAQFLRSDGRLIDAVVRVTLLPEAIAWSRILVMALDVTERNLARLKLEEAAAELAHVARVSTLGQLAATIAHEVNQPLSAIITYGTSGKRWLKREIPDMDEVAICLDQIVSSGKRAAEIIRRVRSLARKSAPQAEPIDMAALVEETLNLMQREGRALGVTMEQVQGQVLPLAIGDRVQVQQVIVNLLMNGIQAMQEVMGRPRALVVSLDAQGAGSVLVSVRDSGCGVSGPDPQLIFRPFFTTKPDGLGMGLSICKSIIEAQGGVLEVSNNSDFGATVAFSLPSQPASVSAPT